MSTLEKANQVLNGMGFNLEGGDEKKEEMIGGCTVKDLEGVNLIGSKKPRITVDDGIYRAEIIAAKVVLKDNWDKTEKDLKYQIIFEIPVQGHESGAWVWVDFFMTLNATQAGAASKLDVFLTGLYGDEFVEVRHDQDAVKKLMVGALGLKPEIMVTRDIGPISKKPRNKFLKVIPGSIGKKIGNVAVTPTSEDKVPF